MSRKHLALAIVGLVAIAGCLLFLTSNTSQLPPGTVKPNAKPALNSSADQTALKVNTAPVSQAVSTDNSSKSKSSPQPTVTAATAVASPTTQSPADCSKPSTTTQAKPVENLTASLSSITDLGNLGLLSGSAPKQGALGNITGALGL